MTCFRSCIRDYVAWRIITCSRNGQNTLCRLPRSFTKHAATLVEEGRYAEAETIAHKTFEAELRTLGLQHSYTLEGLRQLGKAIAHLRGYGEANKLFQDTIATTRDSSGQTSSRLWYSFACMAAAVNHPDDALNHLREAINRGYTDANTLMTDDDLKLLHNNPNFQQLVAQLRQQLEKSK
jgi:hypothetical protein